MISESILYDILESGKHLLSDIKPSEWAESRIVMPKPHAGPLRYAESTPYTKEIIDRFASDDPVTDIALMGSAQFGKTKSIIIPAIGYFIENDPGNIIMTVGHEGLIKEAMADIDEMLDSTGLRKLIKPSAMRAKASQSGDTDTVKQFPGGYFKISSASNPKIWRQANYKIGLIDDYEAVKGSTKIAGNIRDLIEKRFTAYSKTKKIFYVSSPELSVGSNILEVYNMGDQRKFLVPCPCCAEFIELLWDTPPLESSENEKAGITWRLDDDNSLIENSVGYICQACGGFFDDSDKLSITNKGYWKPTKKPVKPEFTSYYMNSLYSPPFMDDWKHYVYKFLECHPPGGGRKEGKYQAFLNLNLGLPYEPTGKAIESNALQGNVRDYEVGTLPEKISIEDGNGKIVMVTCAADINGKLDDARLDYEIVAWTESGSTYSISHGSVGTFIPNESAVKVKRDREKLSYQHGVSNSVWPIFEKIISQTFRTDTKNENGIGRGLKIFMTTLDVGYLDKQTWEFIDKSNCIIRGVKGTKEDKYIKYGVDVKTVKPGLERPKLYIVQIGLIKDDISEYSLLKWNKNSYDTQPSGYMNFPMPSNGLYQNQNFFSHYSAEHRVVIGVDGELPSFRWEKIAGRQNHMFDCRVYNHATRDIIMFEVSRELKVKSFVWTDMVDMILGSKKA